MKISYEDAMAELRTMFQNIEGGTIHELLVKNSMEIKPIFKWKLMIFRIVLQNRRAD